MSFSVNNNIMTRTYEKNGVIEESNTYNVFNGNLNTNCFDFSSTTGTTTSTTSTSTPTGGSGNTGSTTSTGSGGANNTGTTSSAGGGGNTGTTNSTGSGDGNNSGTTTPPADSTPPVITLNGQSSISLTVGDTYTEAGATASDNTDGNLTNNIVITGSVNTSSPGTYKVTYSVNDASNNTASIERTVIITPDTTAPIITLNGQSIIDVRLNSNFSDPGVNANDNVDGDISSSITSSGTVNTSSVGTYIINYSVLDAAGNSNSVSRTVNVISIYFENGTCKCPNASAGDTAVINGTTYTVVDNSTIKDEVWMTGEP